MSQSLPSTLGKYQIIREIARSNDIVYEAYDPVMNRRVAVKELSVPGGSSQQQLEDRKKRFLREARAAGSLVHPHIVTIFEVGQDGDKHFIAMEYLDGENLRQELERVTTIAPDRAIEIAIAVLEGLAFAHEHGVVHRDIKPDNIQILESGQIKLTDFGIARLTFEPNLTMDGQVFGTPSYMSPEQINGREIDARSDIFSVGVVLYEMLAGQKPFPGDSVVSITYAIMNREPVAPSQASFALWQVIQTALDKSPVLRYASARDMINALTQVKSNLHQVVSSPVMPPPAAWTAAQYPGTVVNPNPPPVIGGPVGMPYGVNTQPYPGTGAPAPTSSPYGSYPGYVPPQQYPQYYPPPPRQPVFKPETRQFFGRLLLAVVIIGTLFALVIVGINSLAQAVNQSRASSDVRNASVAEPLGGPAGQPVGTQPTAPASSGSSQPSTAAQEVATAEATIRLAAVEDFDERRRELRRSASEAYSRAVVSDPTLEAAIRDSATRTLMTVAEDLIRAGETRRAREALYQAQSFAVGNSALAEQVTARLRDLGA